MSLRSRRTFGSARASLLGEDEEEELDGRASLLELDEEGRAAEDELGRSLEVDSEGMSGELMKAKGDVMKVA